MWGAVIGDLAGSTYEYSQTKKIEPVLVSDLISDDSFFTDDTILTVAIYDAIREGKDPDYEKVLRQYGERYIDSSPETSFQNHFHGYFGGNFVRWIKREAAGNSIGNGAMMRISGVGKMFDTEEEVIKNAMLATIPSHHSTEAIDCARTVALIIFYARKGLKKEEIREKLDLGVIEYKPFYQFNKTCYDTLNNCLYALFESMNFEDAIRKVLSYGGDTDTNAAIVGSMAEAIYGIPEYLVNQARKKVPTIFSYILDDSYIRKVRYLKM